MIPIFPEHDENRNHQDHRRNHPHDKCGAGENALAGKVPPGQGIGGHGAGADAENGGCGGLNNAVEEIPDEVVLGKNREVIPRNRSEKPLGRDTEGVHLVLERSGHHLVYGKRQTIKPVPMAM